MAPRVPATLRRPSSRCEVIPHPPFSHPPPPPLHPAGIFFQKHSSSRSTALVQTFHTWHTFQNQSEPLSLAFPPGWPSVVLQPSLPFPEEPTLPAVCAATPAVPSTLLPFSLLTPHPSPVRSQRR